MHIYTDGFLIQRLTLNLNVIYSHVCHRPFLKSSGQTARMIKKTSRQYLVSGTTPPPKKNKHIAGTPLLSLLSKKHVTLEQYIDQNMLFSCLLSVPPKKRENALFSTLINKK
jgi:hypothetical protein